MAYVIRYDGTTEDLMLLHLTPHMRMEQIQQTLGGRVEHKTLPDGRVLLMNVLAREFGVPENKVALAMLQGGNTLAHVEPVHGHVLLCTEEEAGLERVNDDTDKPVVLFVVDRKHEIEPFQTERALQRLRLLSATREDVLRHEGTMVLCVEGYDDDSRELVDIPEVRRWFAAVDAVWPYWGWYLDRDDDVLGVLLTILCGGGQRVEQGEQAGTHRSVNDQDLLSRVNRMTWAIDDLAQKRGVNDTYRQRVRTVFAEQLDRMF